MNTLSISEIRNKLKDRRIKVVAEKTGLCYPTIKKIVDNLNCNPTYRTLLVLSNYIKNT